MGPTATIHAGVVANATFASRCMCNDCSTTSCAPVDEQTVVAWIHQRYIWHTTALQDVSHVMFYEDLQVVVSADPFFAAL